MNRKTAYLEHDYARFYDWYYDSVTEDIPFYIELIREYGTPFLEMACGTGRITIPLVREGFAGIGLDLSPEMMKIAEAKLAKEPMEVQKRLQLLQADMTDFSLPEKVKFAFIPQASILHLHTIEAKQRCLSCTYNNLTDAGVFIIDLIPADRLANQVVGETVVCGNSINPSTGKQTRELNKKLSIDKQAQVVTCEHTYIETEADGSEKSFVFVDHYTWVREDEMGELLTEAGFRDITVWGNYDKSPFDADSPRMIFFAFK